MKMPREGDFEAKGIILAIHKRIKYQEDSIYLYTYLYIYLK